MSQPIYVITQALLQRIVNELTALKIEDNEAQYCISVSNIQLYKNTEPVTTQSPDVLIKFYRDPQYGWQLDDSRIRVSQK